MNEVNKPGGVLSGLCHCGAVRVRLTTAMEPASLVPRACQCSFCQKHGVVAISDPSGKLLIELCDPTVVCHYQFGLKSAEFLFCSTCGVYLAAVSVVADRLIGVLNARVLDHFGDLGAPQSVSFEGEDATERNARRLARWTPTVIHGRDPKTSASLPLDKERAL